MESRLQKWGNSSGIRIPSSFLKSLGLKNDDKIEIIQEEDSIIISKPKKRHLTLEERIEMYEKASDSEKGNIETYDWGEDLEKEIID